LKSNIVPGHYYCIFLILLTTCNRITDSDDVSPIVGYWHEAVDETNRNDPQFVDNCESNSWALEGYWYFYDDDTFWYDYVVRTDTGAIEGFSSGLYELLSDTELVVESKYRKNLEYSYFKDIDTVAISIVDKDNFYSIYQNMDSTLCRFYWTRTK